MQRVGLIVALALAVAATAQAQASEPRMAPAVRADIPGKRLFDIGVADPQHDGWLDIFTANHKFESVFLRNHRGRRFSNEIDEMGIGPDGRFPGLDRLRPPDDRSEPGVYIWPTDDAGEAGRLHIASTGVAASGRLKLYTRNLRIHSQEGSTATLARDPDDRPYVDFTLAPGGDLVLASNGLSDLPIVFDFEAPLDAGQIHVGTEGASPLETRFDVMLRDRHGLAFADVAGDPDQDVFVATGGLGGGIASDRFLGFVQDMFMVSGAGPGGRYENQWFTSGVQKDTCRGRAASFADLAGDGNLSLLTTCEGEIPRLFAQVLRGGFVRVPGPPVKGLAYRWAQLGRGSQSLLATTPKGLEVWRYRGDWYRDQIVPVGAGANQIALGDFDNSGTLDVLLAGRGRLRLLRNVRGDLRPVKGSLGLPGSAAAASFVDYDNDGRLDVHLAPQGIFRWKKGGSRGRFVATGKLRARRTGYAIVQWADFDNDGRRDPLIATSQREFSPRSSIVRRRNTTRSGHWLEVDLVGSPTNREALGASVRVDLAGGRRIYQWVGQNDDARHSQGHYRLYFGLGKARKARRVVVRWPGGRTTRIRGVAADRLLRITKGRR